MEYTCGTCGRQFQRKAELARHTKRQNPCRPPAHTCPRCGKGFASSQTLWRHKKTIHGARSADAGTAVEHPYCDAATATTGARNADTLARSASVCKAQDQQATACGAGVCKTQDTQQQAQGVAVLREALEYTQAKADDADRLREGRAQRLAAAQQQREEIRGLHDLVGLQRSTLRTLLERDAEAHQREGGTAATLAEAERAKAEAERAKAEAERAKADAEQALRMEIRSMAQEYSEVLEGRQQRIATLESQNEELRESLAEAQTARLVLSEQQEKSKQQEKGRQKSKKRARGRKK